MNDPWAAVLSPEESRDVAILAAEMGECNLTEINDSSIIADCLRAKTVEELIEIHRKVRF